MYYAYLLISLKDGDLYKGSTSNLEERIKAHNSGKVRSTKGRRPLELHYFETFETKTEARKRELFFKSIDGYNWLKENKII